MKAAAANLEFEKAAAIRDEIKRLRARSLGVDDVSALSAAAVTAPPDNSPGASAPPAGSVV